MRARNENRQLSAWRQTRDEKVIAREDGYTYIASLRSPDLRHTTKREGDTSVTVVTSNNDMMTGILLDKLLVYYTDMYPTELNHNQQLANPNTLCR
jgi:hypothetical protein